MATLACNHCGKQLDGRVGNCRHCGAPQSSSITFKLIALGLLAICLAASAYAIAHSRRAAFSLAANIPLAPALEGDAQMRTMAQLFVMRSLQSPATAKFAPPAEWQTTPINKSTSRMHAWVDSENAAGTTLRANFSIAIRLNEDTASLLYLQFDDDEKPMFGERPLTAEEKKL
ncbi:MAG TPA: hypothetical protein VH107_19410 [Lacipirellulaceae bacterium]|jgi:hypothetical protein|nr:hypothetical protein [Lacipirellulaceae bacterium]